MVPDERVDQNHFWPPRDRTGMKVLHRIELPGLLRAVPSVLKYFDRRVPGEFMAESVEDGVPIIVIACPCGAEPTLRWRTRSYSIEECQCGRFFLHDGKEIRVAQAEEPEGEPEPAS